MILCKINFSHMFICRWFSCAEFVHHRWTSLHSKSWGTSIIHFLIKILLIFFVHFSVLCMHINCLIINSININFILSLNTHNFICIINNLIILLWCCLLIYSRNSQIYIITLHWMHHWSFFHCSTQVHMDLLR